MKGIISEMQINVSEHALLIRKDLVTEEKLRVGLELNET